MGSVCYLACYSTHEIGLSILAASLTALRPGFRNSTSLSAGLGSLVTFGHGTSNKGPAYRLEDRDVSVVDSQENIVPVWVLTPSLSTVVLGKYRYRVVSVIEGGHYHR